MTLVEFLVARIAEDEAAERSRDFADRTHARRCELVWVADHNDPECDCDGSARALRECDAKLRIIDLATRPEHWSLASPWVDALMALAAIYADHPEYRPEWAA